MIIAVNIDENRGEVYFDEVACYSFLKMIDNFYC